jgi:hypothetical protein
VKKVRDKTNGLRHTVKRLDDRLKVLEAQTESKNLRERMEAVRNSPKYKALFEWVRSLSEQERADLYRELRRRVQKI